ncbi:hypothetical protein D3C80_687830 [compost metagenome]
MLFFAGLNVIGTRFNSRFHDLVGIANSNLVNDLANAIEHESCRAGFAQRATRLGESSTNIGCGAITVVSQRFNDDHNAARAAALVAHFIIVFTVIAGGLLDGALDIVFRHRLRLGVLNCQTQARVHQWVRQTLLGRDSNFASELGKHFRPHGILAPFAMHDILKL